MSAPQTEVLVFVGGQEIARHVLGLGVHTFGTSEACSIRIEAASVSRRHAQLTVGEDGSLLLEDLGSTNGTLLDGQRITVPTPVAPNQSIEIGKATLLIQQRASGNGSADGMPPELSEVIRYEPGAEIARGGMGAVLAARQPAIRREVALKVMIRDPSAHDRLRFIEEAQITGQLEHPNIVPVHDLALNEQGQPYYTMKLVKGSSLKEILKLLAQGAAATVAKYPLAALLTIFQKVCDAVAFAHARGVIHRDLKPANIMVGEYGEVLVMDWGLAKVIRCRPSVPDGTPAPASGTDALQSAVALALPIATARDDQRDNFATLDGAVMGTPHYMSPEQARGEVATLDQRSDLFSLGAILYELVTLLPPFPGKTTREILSKIKSGHFDLPNVRLRATDAKGPQHLPGGVIPDSLEAVISKALALDRDQRYQRVADLQADLTAYQSGFATSAENAGPWKQFKLLVGRHKLTAGIIAASLMLLLGITFAFTISVVSERNRTVAERDRAESALIQVKAERDRANTAKAEAQAERGRAEDALNGLKVQTNRAETALADLRKTAPTFHKVATSLLNEGKSDEAMEKIGYAIQLDGTNADYRLFRANLLETMQKLSEAIAEYRQVLGLHPSDQTAQINLTLCERLIAANEGGAVLRKDLQKELLAALREQQRLTEAGLLSAVVEPERVMMEANLRARLQSYRQQPDWDDHRLSAQPDGTYKLVLDHLQLGDFSVLKGFPISALSLAYTDISDLHGLAALPLRELNLLWTQVKDLTPLQSMPLESLNLQSTPVTDLSPLSHLKLRRLIINQTMVSDIKPLAGVPLEHLSANNTLIDDLSALRGAPLTYLSISACPVRSLLPLAGMPLVHLDISYNDLINFIDPLATCTQLKDLYLQHTRTGNSMILPQLSNVTIHK